MKHIKQILSAVGTLCLLLALLPGLTAAVFAEETVPGETTIVASGSYGDNVTWKVDSQGLLTLSGQGDMADLPRSEIPWKAYSYTSVVVEEGITSIGSSAFCASQISSVSLPEGLLSISPLAFDHCPLLTEIILPESLVTIEDEAFSFGALTSITIPGSVTSIGQGAFMYSDLVSIHLSASVSSIGEDAFLNSDLEEIYVDPDNQTFRSLDGVLYSRDGTTLLFYPRCKPDEIFVIPEGVTTIAEEGVYSGEMKQIVFPESIRQIGVEGFSWCDMEKLVFLGDAPVIDETGFYAARDAVIYYPADNGTWTADKRLDYGGMVLWVPYETRELPTTIVAEGVCGENVTWTLDAAGTLTVSGQGAMDSFAAGSLQERWGGYSQQIKTLVVRDDVSAIGDYAFCDCGNLDQMAISASVDVIGDHAFEGCGSLTSAYLPGVDSIGSCAFYLCTGLREITVGHETADIGASAFACCRSLEEITLPETVETLGSRVFEGCTSLTEVRFTGEAPDIGSAAFTDVTATCYYPATASGWTADVMQNYGGSLTWTAYGQFEIPLASMSMGNSLAMNFAFVQSDMEDWDDCYARIVKTYSDGREDVVETVPYSEWKAITIRDIAHYYVTFDGVAAKEMADEVYVTICNADGVAVSDTKTDSVRAQSMRALENDISDEEKTMIVDMLNYGAAAQEYFGYNTGDLANALLTPEQEGYASASEACVNTRVSSGSFAASTVVLKSNIQMMFAFGNVDETHYAIVTFTNHRGEEKRITIPGDQFTANGSARVVTVDGLVVADGRQNVTCVVYDAGGSEVASVTDSIASYTARSGGSSDLFVKMMRYSDSAYHFFHS